MSFERVSYLACYTVVVFFSVNGSLHVVIGLDEAFCACQGSSRVDIPHALRAPSAEVPSTLHNSWK